MALKQLLCSGVLVLDFEQAFFTKQIVDLKFFMIIIHWNSLN